jgi:ribosomal protein S8E
MHTNILKTTETFIKESQIKHKNENGLPLFNYTKTKYINAKTKVIITCSEHGDFNQTPGEHLRGYGCFKCGCEKRSRIQCLTIEEFIQKAQTKNIKENGEPLWSYEKTKYINAKTKVIITCNKHGDFKVTPNKHLTRGDACNICSREQMCIKMSSNTIEFIKKAQVSHINENDREPIYTYKNTIYKNSHTKVIITCSKHGDFLQTPANHLWGYGCIKCSQENSGSSQRLTTDEFIKKAQQKHKNDNGEPIYMYKNTQYINAHTQVEIICNIHGTFKQIPCNHLNGNGCPKCCQTNCSKSQIEWLKFISKLNNIHIIHSLNGGEFVIPNTKFKADGYCKETNTIYEYHGDYWHGNPKRFDKDKINKTTDCTFGELYKTTLEREQIIKELGYNLIIMWENDWNKINKSIKYLQRKLRMIYL